MLSSDLNRLVRHQFDKQAKNFSEWSVTSNIEYLQRYFEFCMLNREDTLLDIACGSGEFAIFAAPKIKQVSGIDISEGMIALAKETASSQKITNVNFTCHDVEIIPFDDPSFSIIVCRNAFHHFNQYNQIFNEMVRCCEMGGRISIQDIIAYEDTYVNDFFETLEKEIDISHYNTLTKEFIIGLYNQNKIEIKNTYELEIELNLRDYLSHAKQTAENREKIEKLLKIGLNDNRLSSYFILKDEDILFRRNVFIILGIKKPE